MSMLKATVLKRSVKWNSKTFRKLQKESLKGVLRKCCSGTFQNIHRKTSESESPFNTVAGCWPGTLLKSDWCFPVRLAIFFKRSFFTEHLRPIYLKLLWSVAKLQTKGSNVITNESHHGLLKNSCAVKTDLEECC